jgi:predicted nucleotidyltransferase
MNHPLISLLLPEYRRQILGLLLLHPHEQLHGREIARRTKLAPGTVTRELGKLVQAGFLLREKRGNQQLYKADTSCVIFAELASILKKTSGIADVLSDALSSLGDAIQICFIYGSIARGSESADSDIDLMIIGTVNFQEAVQALWPFQTQLAREINPKVFSPCEWKARLSEPFLREVLAKEKIFLKGSANDLTELAGNQSGCNKD